MWHSETLHVRITFCATFDGVSRCATAAMAVFDEVSPCATTAAAVFDGGT
jgi:hypothetical protein